MIRIFICENRDSLNMSATFKISFHICPICLSIFPAKVLILIDNIYIRYIRSTQCHVVFKNAKYTQIWRVYIFLIGEIANVVFKYAQNT